MVVTYLFFVYKNSNSFIWLAIFRPVYKTLLLRHVIIILSILGLVKISYTTDFHPPTNINIPCAINTNGTTTSKQHSDCFFPTVSPPCGVQLGSQGECFLKINGTRCLCVCMEDQFLYLHNVCWLKSLVIIRFFYGFFVCLCVKAFGVRMWNVFGVWEKGPVSLIVRIKQFTGGSNFNPFF